MSANEGEERSPLPHRSYRSRGLHRLSASQPREAEDRVQVEPVGRCLFSHPEGLRHGSVAFVVPPMLVAEDGVEVITEVANNLEPNEVGSWHTDVNVGVARILQHIARS